MRASELEPLQYPHRRRCGRARA